MLAQNKEKLAAIQKAAQLIAENTELIFHTAITEGATIIHIVELFESGSNMLTSTSIKKVDAACRLLGLSWYIDTVDHNGTTRPKIALFTVLANEA